jgi:alcohol dehydrogenase (NADP+)
MTSVFCSSFAGRKYPNTSCSHAPEKVEEGLNTTLKELGLEYLDLYLMHWPVGNDPSTGKLQYDYLDTWHAMEDLLRLGTVRQIGVSNFSPHQLAELVRKSSIKPAVHQMELHPYLQQRGWVAFHKRQGIEVTAFSPLGDSNPTYHRTGNDEDPPRLLGNEVLSEIGKKRNCTTAQVSLAWNLARDVVVIPKTSHVHWIQENYAATECPLSWGDIRRIYAIQDKWVKRYNNPSDEWGVKLFEGLQDS